MSNIKGLLRHSKRKGKKKGFRWRKHGRFKMIILRALRAQQGRGERKGTKIREPRRRNSSYILEIIQDITLVSKE